MDEIFNNVLEQTKQHDPSLLAAVAATARPDDDPLTFNGSKRRGLVSLQTMMEVRKRLSESASRSKGRSVRV